MTKLRIGFAGTPEFSISCLQAIADSPHDLCVIYTQPDRPAGRGRKIQKSPVKQWAETHHVPVLQPINFRSVETQAEFIAHQLDVLVVVAYGLILPSVVLTAPRYGCINVHASLLPRWRGASPIQHALLYGDAETGITIMQMDRGMDTGNILAQTPLLIPTQATAASLHDALAHLATTPLLDTLHALPDCLSQSVPQADTGITYAPKLSKQDALIDWHRPAAEIERTIRAFNPWPVAYTHSTACSIRIYQAHILESRSQLTPGTVLELNANGLNIATKTEDLCIESIQFAGGKVVQVTELPPSSRKLLTAGTLFQ